MGGSSSSPTSGRHGGGHGPGDRSSVERRRFLTYGAMTAGALAVTPTVLSLDASPAAASGAVTAQYGNARATLTNRESLSATGLGGTGLVVVTIVSAGGEVPTITSGTGNTWTAVHDPVEGSGLMMATYSTLVGGAQSSATFTATWTTAARSVLTGTYFATATRIHDSRGKYTPSSTTAITAPAGLAVPGGSAAVLFVAAVLRTASNTPMFTAPSGFAHLTNLL